MGSKINHVGEAIKKKKFVLAAPPDWGGGRGEKGKERGKGEGRGASMSSGTTASAVSAAGMKGSGSFSQKHTREFTELIKAVGE